MVAGYEAKIRSLEEEGRVIAEQLHTKCSELAETVRLLDVAETTVVERTVWAQRLEAERGHLAQQLDLVRTSSWLKLGRKVGLGPVLNQP
jgi:hypothetical protein